MEKLAQTIAEYELDIDPSVLPMLDAYREQLWSWNEKLNLTRHTTMEKFVTRDVIDSLQLANLLSKRERVLDVGTGGGVPGVVMAILRPDLRVHVCESTGKKAQAVGEIVRTLDLPIQVHHARAEDVLGIRTFDTLVARAVAPLEKLLRWFEPHWGSFHQMLIIKGRSWPEERGKARHLGLLNEKFLRRAAVYTDPKTEAESVILKICEAGDASEEVNE